MQSPPLCLYPQLLCPSSQSNTNSEHTAAYVTTSTLNALFSPLPTLPLTHSPTQHTLSLVGPVNLAFPVNGVWWSTLIVVAAAVLVIEAGVQILVAKKFPPKDIVGNGDGSTDEA